MNNTQQICYVCGHRPQTLPFGSDEGHPNCLRLKVCLLGAIDVLRQDGVTTFLTDMAQGIGLIAAELVLTLKQTYPGSGIRLVAVLPYEGQANEWNEATRERYFQILSKADEVITLQQHYTSTCMQAHSRYLVDASSHLIAVWNGSRGTTGSTVAYAEKQGLSITILHPETLQKKCSSPATVRPSAVSASTR